MRAPDDYTAFVLDRLCVLGMSGRAMFGGQGHYRHGVFLGLTCRERLFQGRREDAQELARWTRRVRASLGRWMNDWTTSTCMSPAHAVSQTPPPALIDFM